MASETQLTLAARALGFDESAKSVDLLAQAQARLAENQKALEQAKLSGTIGDIGKLTSDQRNLNTVIEGTTPAVEQLQGELAGLNIRQQDMVGILNQLDPRLGALAATLSRSSRIAGEFGISLGTVGIAVAGVTALAKAWEYAAEQIEKATEAQKKNQEATNKFLKQQKDLQQSLETISDKRREGGFTADQARAARGTAAGIRERFGADLDEGAIDEAVALLSGTGASTEEIERAAFANQRGTLDLDAGQSAGRRRSRAQRVTGRGGERGAFDTLAARVAQQRRETQEQARQQAINGGGPELEEVARQALGPGTPDEDVQRALENIEKLNRPHVAPDLFSALFGGQSTLKPEYQMSEAERDRARMVLNVINNYNQNWKNIGSDAESKAAREVTGQSIKEKVER